jgi:hypothetical protein
MAATREVLLIQMMRYKRTILSHIVEETILMMNSRKRKVKNRRKKIRKEIRKKRGSKEMMTLSIKAIWRSLITKTTISSGVSKRKSSRNKKDTTTNKNTTKSWKTTNRYKTKNKSRITNSNNRGTSILRAINSQFLPSTKLFKLIRIFSNPETLKSLLFRMRTNSLLIRIVRKDN